MPITEFEADLEKGPRRDWLRVRIETERGDPYSFTVQYETTVDDERIPVVRYDTAHGRPHRDLLDRRGRTVGKRFLPAHWTTKRALEHAHKDLKENWRDYRERFLRRTS